MLFNSLEFGLFLPIVFIGYWFVFQKNLRIRNFFLLAISYYFYACWDWRFLSLIILSSFVDYNIGLRIGKAEDDTSKKRLLWISLLFNLGLLAVFKYFNFFIDSFVETFRFMGGSMDYSSINIVIPIGISFYTFQTMSYAIDIYREKLKPTDDIIAFFAFVSFFPQLVAGPIERAQNLLPQFLERKRFDREIASDGMRQILWGFFKKVAIADACGIFVNEIFANNLDYSWIALFLGTTLFAIQVYCDFSGYSDIAIGTAKLFNFKLMTNFKTPYHATNWGDFWKRWHISLSSWILDYVYYPIALNKRDWQIWGVVFGLMVTFTLNGLWHGANWTFVLFGILLGVYISVEFLLKKKRKTLKKKIGKSFMNFSGWLLTMVLWVLALVLFRAESLQQSIEIYQSIFSFQSGRAFGSLPVVLMLLLVVLFVVEWVQRNKEHGLEINLTKVPKLARWATYLGVFYIIILFGVFKQDQFIYFQF